MMMQSTPLTNCRSASSLTLKLCQLPQARQPVQARADAADNGSCARSDSELRCDGLRALNEQLDSGRPRRIVAGCTGVRLFQRWHTPGQLAAGPQRLTTGGQYS